MKNFLGGYFREKWGRVVDKNAKLSTIYPQIV